MNRGWMGIIVAGASVVISVTVLFAAVWVGSRAAQACEADLCVSGDDPCVPGSCTIFAVRRGDKVFFGNNENWSDLTTIYWVEPSRPGHCGSVYLGFNAYNPQGGINEKGLAFDYNALPPLRKGHPDAGPPPGRVGPHC